MATNNGNKNVTADVTSGIGILSFPHLFKETAETNDKGETFYSVQLIIPKTQKDDLRALIAAIKKVGQAKFGDNYKNVRLPLRDGDREANELTEDGQTTKGEKYPERLGCMFLNAKTKKPVGVVNRKREPILDPDEVYGGCKARVALQFYTYSTQGNHGVGASIQGVQKVGEGEPFGAARQPIESMFDVLDDDDDLDGDDGLGYDDADEAEEKPKAKKDKSKKAKKSKSADNDDDLLGDSDDSDPYDEL